MTDMLVPMPVVPEKPEASMKAEIEIKETLKDFPFQNITMQGQFIKVAKQERRGNKIVLVDPKGKVVLTMRRLDAGWKRNHASRKA